MRVNRPHLIRETATVVIVSNDGIPVLTGRNRRRTDRPRSGRVTVVKVDARVMRTALELADGDPSRLRIHEDGSVTVENGPRA
jgi:hypothetical protein